MQCWSLGTLYVQDHYRDSAVSGIEPFPFRKPLSFSLCLAFLVEFKRRSSQQRDYLGCWCSFLLPFLISSLSVAHHDICYLLKPKANRMMKWHHLAGQSCHVPTVWTNLVLWKQRPMAELGVRGYSSTRGPLGVWPWSTFWSTSALSCAHCWAGLGLGWAEPGWLMVLWFWGWAKKNDFAPLPPSDIQSTSA